MLKQMRLAWCKGLLALMLLAGSAAEAQDVFFTQSGGRGLQNAKTNARLSKAETDIGVIQDDLKTIRPFARREIPSCDSTGAKLLWRGDNWSCDDEIDPTVQPFAKKELPTCGAGQILSASGSDFSCANSGFLSAETDPTVQPFAKQPLPSCGTGTVLSVGAAGDLKCVADNQGLTAETDPYVHDFARTDKATITNCGAGEVLKMVGFRLACVEDKGIEFETDPNVQAFARNDIAGASLAACGADQVVVAESSGANVILACKNGATALGGVLSAQTLAGLADTTIAAPASNQILRFNGTAWVNSSDKIGTTTDNRWCYFTAGNITCDRNIPAPMPAAACASTQIITWDGTAWGCQNIASAIGGNLTLGSLSDVTITAPIAGQGLTFDGTGWVNGYNTRIAQGNSDVRVVDTGTGAIQLVPDGVATLTALQGQVGINNNTPNAALDVIGLISGTNISTAGWVNAGLVQASGYVSASQLHTSGTVYGGELRSTSDTRVGQDLYVVGNLYVSGTQQFDGVTFANGGVSATGTVTATSFAGDGSLLTGVTAASVDKVISGSTRIVANENTTISFSTAGNERMVLRENGRLGLGTSNPQTELEVNGSISATNLFLSGNLNVSGTQNIDGVIFANGGVSATGAVTATSFAGDGSLITGVTADNMPWHRLTSVPNPIRFISDSTLTAAEVEQLQNINTSILPASVWSNLAYLNQSVSTTSAPTFDGLTLTGNLGGTNAILSGYLTAPSATITNATIDNDLRVRGNLYVSGTQNIDGVIFANGGVSATGAVTATSFAGDGSLITGVTADNMPWHRLTSVPNPIRFISDSTLTAAEVEQLQNINTSILPASVWSNLAYLNQSVSTTSAPTFDGLTLTGNLGGTNAILSGYLTAPSATITNATIDNDLRVRGNLYVSGSQNIEGVLFADGGIQATGTVTATTVTATAMNAYYASFTTLTAGNLSGNVNWYDLQNIPNQVQLVSDSGNINLANLGVTGTVTASTVSATTLNSRYLSSTEGWIGALTAPVASVGALNVTSGTLTHLTAHGGNLNNMAGISVSGIVSATFFEGDGSRLTNVVADSADAVDWPNITNKPASIVSLSTLAAAAANNFIMADGTDWTVVNAAAARTGLGLGTMATQNANAVGISGGSITGLTSLSVAGIVTATYFEGDGSRLTGITADSVDSILWDNILAIPAQVQQVSDSGNINLANLGVTGTVTASTVSATTLNSRYLSSTEGWIGALTAPVASVGALNVTSGTLTHLTAHGGNLNNMAGISVSGIVSATFFEGDGSRLTNVVADSADAVDWPNITNKPASIVSLSTLAAAAANNFIMADGTDWTVVNAAAARTGLGLGTMATQNANAVGISGGSITGLTSLSVAGIVTATYFEGDGSRLTNINASEIVGLEQDRIVSGTTNITAYNDASLTFTTANQQRMVIDERGFVGVGVSVPLATWHVEGPALVTSNTEVSGTIKLSGTGDETCSGAQKFTIRANPTTGAMEVCLPGS